MNIAMIGAACALGFSAIGSGIGAGISSMAAIGAWKRNYLANKPASFLLVAFAGAPLTQTIYGFILMGRLLSSSKDILLILAAGIISGIAIGMSAIAQGQAAASACDAFGETGKGFANYITVIGLTETVALFTLAFTFSVA
ncbi:MAG: V-type ATP synthase subunit K [Rectinema subterraneum]|uniref:V-type ATP synthase subunit K n=1 Tax=Rectinema subterraneum TaxID=2653714 RepID=UPI003C7BE1DB